MKLHQLPTPVYVIDEDKLTENLKILRRVERSTGCKILLAQKAFSAYCEYPLIGQYISGTTARFCPAYLDGEFDEIADICDHIVFNSFAQKQKFYARRKNASVGLRVNPEFSTQETAIYDPCAPGSRFGVTKANFREDLLDGIEGLHMHTLCEQGADALAATVEVFEQKFGEYLRGMRQVYLEPGEAIALNAGLLATKVLEIVENGIQTAILDASAACHMPDVLEMPYRPPLKGSGLAGQKKYTYRLSARTCLAGDIIGDYSFDEQLSEGDILYFEDMAIYSMVKNNTFNGMPLPAIAAMRGGECSIVKEFGYADFKSRLS